MKARQKIVAGVATVVVVLAAVVVLAGCGGASKGASASTTASPGGTLSQLQSLRTYFDQVTPLVGKMTSSLGSLPSAVSGLSKVPDATWTSAAIKLDDIAAQLGDEASSLAALKPPAALQSAQTATVNGIKSAQAGVAKAAGLLNAPANAKATAKAKVEAAIGAAETQLSQVTQQLMRAVTGLMASPSPTP